MNTFLAASEQYQRTGMNLESITTKPIFASDRNNFAQDILKAHEFNFNGLESELKNFLQSRNMILSLKRYLKYR